MVTASVFFYQQWVDQLVVATQRTGYTELALGGAPILFEWSFHVDSHAILSILRPIGMAGPHMDLRAHLGYR